MRIVEEDEEGMPIGDGSQAPSTHVLLIHNSTLNDNEYYMFIYNLPRKPLKNSNLLIITKDT